MAAGAKNGTIIIRIYYSVVKVRCFFCQDDIFTKTFPPFVARLRGFIVFVITKVENTEFLLFQNEMTSLESCAECILFSDFLEFSSFANCVSYNRIGAF